jgi:hypothetical protein
MSEATQTESKYKMPTPGPEHHRFRPFAGKFRSEVKMWMGPGEPMVSTGTMINTLELGGLYLQQDYVGDPNDGPFPSFEGKGFWGFNPDLKRYEGFWIDNASSFMQNETGQVDAAGKVWEMHSEMFCGQTGQVYKKRSIIRLIDNDHHTMEMFFTGPDGNEMKNMEIMYTRVA